MQYRKLGNTGLFTTDLTLGTMMFGDDRDKGTPAKEAKRILDAYLDAGGNHIDTANVYVGGRSEEILGEAIGSRRSNIILATKANFPTEEGINNKGLSRYNIIRSVEASLKRLQTDYLDLFYMHCQDTLTPIEESLAAYDQLVQDGKVRYIGVSNFQAWRLMKALGLSDANGWARFVAAQYQYSLVKRDIEYEFTDLFAEEGLGLLPWGPLGGGFLSGKYKRGQQPDEGRIATHPDHTEEAWHRRNTERNWQIIDVLGQIAENRNVPYAQVALAWVRQRPQVCSVVIGARTMAQLESNLQSAEWQLTEEEMNQLNKVSQPAEMYPYRMIAAYGRKAE